MNFILESNIKKSDVSAPILSKSKAISRQIEQEKIQYRARKILAAERKSKLNKDRVLPDVRELDYERKLRKVATRGVVKLFNAIKTAQSKSMSELNNSGIVVTSSTKAKVANISKSTFFELLKKQSSATSFNPNKPLPPPSSSSFNSTSEFSSGISSDSISKSITPSPNNTVAQTQNQDKIGETKTQKGWSVLSEGYLMDSRLQGWDQAEEMDL
ncbi:Rrp15p-domain-containing protein [Paraphysoderma sedebokerense]|nr:Rrp15p-domain-containing protein [Paraphysoderma sedebokerense]